MVFSNFFTPIVLNIFFINFILMRFLIHSLVFLKKNSYFFLKSLSNRFNVVSVLNIFLILHFTHIIMFRGCYQDSNNFSLNNAHVTIVYINLIMFSFYINFFKKKSFFFTITCFSYVNTAFFLVFTNNFYLFFIVLELISYSFLLVIVSLFFENVFFFKNKGFLNILFIQLILNFFSSILFYFILFYSSYFFGSTSYSIFFYCQKTPMWFNILFCFTIFFKTSVGPWFLWNSNIYENISTTTLYMYISVFFLLIFFPILRFLNFLGFFEKVLTLFCFFVVNIYINYNIYNIKTVKTFLLFSSYSIYIIYMYVICCI
jgi:hypothetical protein